MGNSIGKGLKNIWELIRKHPHLQGGFIWDFADQSCHWKNKEGEGIYGYGGDFSKYDASDNNFCDNGLVSLIVRLILTCMKSGIFIKTYGLL